MKWNDIDEIVEALDAKYSDLDLDNVKFGRLEQMITNLPEFEDIDDLASPAIEEVLQEILESWLEYRHNQ